MTDHRDHKHPDQDRSDDDLLAELQAALAAAPEVPDTMRAAADAAWTWRTVDDELLLADLTFDSRLQQVSGLRGAPAASRTMVFDWPAGTTDVPAQSLEIEVLPGRMIGQLVPVAVGRVRVLTAAGEYSATDTDETGSFGLDRPRGGAVRLTFHTGAAKGQTEWLVL